MCKENHKKVVAAVWMLLCTNSAWALEWQYQRGFDLGLSQSDNIFFSSTDLAESGSIVNVSPIIGITALGRKSEFSLEAAGRYQSFPDQGTDSFVPVLDANLSFELVEDMLSTNIGTSVTQVDSDEIPVFEDSIALTSDTSNQYSGSFNTNFNYDIERVGNFLLDHTYSVIDNTSDLQNDSFDNTSRIRLSQLRGTEQPGWGVEGRHQRTVFSDLDESAEVYSLFGAFGLLASREWLLTAGFGQEWANSGDNDTTSRDDIWDLTLAWRPNAQNSLVFGYGERSFGSNPTLEYTLSGRRSIFSAYWRRNYANTQLVSGAGVASSDETSTPIDDLEVAAEVPEHLLVGRQLLVDDEIGMTLQLMGRLSSIVLNGTYLVREDRANQTNVRNALISASFNRQLNTDISWEIGYVYRELLPSSDTASSFENRIQLTLSYSN